MYKTIHTPRVILAALAALWSGVGLTASDVAYREIFPTGPHAAACGWQLHHSDKAWEGSKDQCWGAAPGAGKEKAVNSLSEDEDDAEAWKGFVWLANGDRYLFWTAETTFAANTIERVSVHLSAKDPQAVVRLALRIGDAWYASEQTVSEAVGASIPDSKPTVFDVAGKTFIPFAWKPYEMLPATVTGSAAPLPSGVVTAVGFLAGGKTQVHSYDTVEVITVHGVADATHAMK